MNFDQDFDKFLALLTIIADYQPKTLSEGVQMLYWRGLQKYDFAAVEKALWDHVGNPDNGHHMPKIADVVRHLQGRTVDQAAIAWSKVDAAVRPEDRRRMAVHRQRVPNPPSRLPDAW